MHATRHFESYGKLVTEIRGKWRNLRSLIHVETQKTQLDSHEVRREVHY